MQRILALSFVVFQFCAFSSFAEGADTAPRFGGKERSAEEQRLDKILVGEAIAKHASRDGARDMFLQQVVELARKGDGDGAMRAANKAWLVDPKSYRVGWGFAVALGAQGTYDQSVEFFKEAAVNAGDDGAFYCDYGLSLFRQTLLAKLPPEKQSAQFDEVEKVYRQAIAFTPSSDCGLAGLSVVAFARGDLKRSWGLVADAEKLGGKSLDPRFLKDLETQMPRPKV